MMALAESGIDAAQKSYGRSGGTGAFLTNSAVFQSDEDRANRTAGFDKARATLNAPDPSANAAQKMDALTAIAAQIKEQVTTSLDAIKERLWGG